MENGDTENTIPEEINCRLTVKTGVPLSACRDKGVPIGFKFKVTSGVHVFRSTVQSHFKESWSGWSDTRDIHIKPSNNVSQKGYIRISDSSAEFKTLLKTVWRRARLRKSGQDGFVLTVFVYVEKIAPEPTANLRRATESRIRQQLPRVAAQMREAGMQIGPAAQLYMAVSQARLAGGTPVALPNNTTFQQLQYIDSEQAHIRAHSLSEAASCAVEYVVVRIRVYEVEVPVRVNLDDLRSVLGLPSYNLRPPFREPVPTEITPPATGMNDIDHDDDNTNERTEDFI